MAGRRSCNVAARSGYIAEARRRDHWEWKLIDHPALCADDVFMTTVSRAIPVKRARRRKPAKAPASTAQASNTRLKKLAKVHRPPQEWFEQTDCPFTPAKS